MQVVVDGILTNYQKLGEQKEVLLILHGWGRSLGEWLPTAKQLSDRYTVILVDLPGFGTTPRSEKTMDTYEYAEFVQHFLEKLEVKKCKLLGHSFGGRLGIILAAKRNMIETLVLVDAAGIEDKSAVVKAKSAINKFLGTLFPSPLKKKLQNYLASNDYKTAGAMRDVLVKVVNQDLRHLLKDIEIPTFIIWGERDNQLPVTQTKLFKKAIPESTVRIVWEAGHDPHLEKPREFMEIMEEVL